MVVCPECGGNQGFCFCLKIRKKCIDESCGKTFSCAGECGRHPLTPCWCPECAVKNGYKKFIDGISEPNRYYCKSRFPDGFDFQMQKA